MMMLNNVVIAGKLAADPKSKQFGDNTLVEVTLQIAQLKKVKGEWVHQHYTLDAQAWNKTAEKILKLATGLRAVFIGKLCADLFEYDGKPRQKIYLDVMAIESVDKPATAPAAQAPTPATTPRPRQAEIPEPATEDDLPF